MCCCYIGSLMHVSVHVTLPPSVFLMSPGGVVGQEKWGWSERGGKSSTREIIKKDNVTIAMTTESHQRESNNQPGGESAPS